MMKYTRKTRQLLIIFLSQQKLKYTYKYYYQIPMHAHIQLLIFTSLKVVEKGLKKKRKKEMT